MDHPEVWRKLALASSPQSCCSLGHDETCHGIHDMTFDVSAYVRYHFVGVGERRHQVQKDQPEKGWPRHFILVFGCLQSFRIIGNDDAIP